MTLRELINKLTTLGDEHGYNKEVTVTDGWETICFKGNFEIVYCDWDGGFFDIGVGGCRDE